MKIYLSRYAPNPRRVAMFLAEKGVDVATEYVDLTTGAHKADTYRSKNPLAQTPALEMDDGRILTESRAICTYLESVFPEPNLMGRDGFERGYVEMWDRRAELALFLPLVLWVRHGHKALAAVETNQVQAVSDYYRDQGMAGARFFDAQLADRRFVAGDSFTIADITLLAGVDFAKMMKWRPDETLPNLTRWRAEMGERPAGKTQP